MTAQILREKINSAATITELTDLEASVDRHYCAGAITARELASLDDRLMVRRAKLEATDA
jgi:hypothetical protein